MHRIKTDMIFLNEPKGSHPDLSIIDHSIDL